nr:hypothetical protein [Tanacetum cinerariifolium]
MLEKSMYTSWSSGMQLYIKGKEKGRKMLNSIDNGPLVYGTIEENGVTQPKKYEELTDAEKLQDDYDVKEKNIILQGLPPEVYSLVNHHQVAKEILDRVKLLMQGTELSYQERECKLYDDFDRFSLYKPPVITQQPFVPHIVYPSLAMSQKPQAEFPQLDLCLTVSSFLPESQDTQPTIIYNDAFLNDDLYAFDLDCDEAPCAKAFLMANLSSYDSNVISEVPISETIRDNFIFDNDVQGMYYYEQPTFDPASDIKITSDSNIISYAQYLKETENAAVHNNTSTEQQNVVILLVFDGINNQVAKYCDEAPCAKAVLMDNLSSYDSNVISEVPISETIRDNFIFDNDVQGMYYSEQPTFDPASDIEITSDSNIISYAQYLKETENAAVHNNTSTEQQNVVILLVFDGINNQVAKCNDENI